jgi:hypothetical protein
MKCSEATIVLITLLMLAVPVHALAQDQASKNTPAATSRQSINQLRQAAKTDWDTLAKGACAANPKTDDCAAAAIVLASGQCAISAQQFTKSATGWRFVDFTLIVVSAVSTAVGASTTIANSKVWSTLGGTTGIGAATTAASSFSTADQGGITAVGTTLSAFKTFLAGTNGNPPSALQIYENAPIYAAQCEAAAAASPNAKQ